MTDKAVFLADFVDMAFKPGLKVARVSFDIPIEKAAEFIATYGAPDRVNPVKCALARLQLGPDKKAGEEPAITAAPETDAAQGQGKPRHRSNLAAIMVKENDDFKAWLVDRYWTGKEEIGDYDGLLKRALKITSKKELDTDPVAAERFDQLTASFAYRNTVRQ